MEMSIEGGKDESTKNARVLLELAEGALPKTVQNFIALCEDEELGYVGTKVNRIEKKVGICIGAAGMYCHPSVSPTGIFEDEGHFISHTKPGIISMMSPGVDKNDSRFVITTGDAPQLDGKFVAFGRVLEDESGVLDAVQKIFTKRGEPSLDINIVGCGVL